MLVILFSQSDGLTLLVIAVLSIIVYSFFHLIKNVMETLQKLRDAVAKNTATTDSAIVLIRGLAEQIRNCPADTAFINALADEIDAKATELGGAVTENTGS